MSRNGQQEIFPGYNETRAAAERQARAWSPPAADTPPAPRWVTERGRDAEPGTSPALPECHDACPWRKPKRVILAERVLAENGEPWPDNDECHHPKKFHREVEDFVGEVCWPTLAALRVGPPDAQCAGDGACHGSDVSAVCNAAACDVYQGGTAP